MSAKERMGRLQELLERVQTRAAAPRGNGALHAVAYEAAHTAHDTPAPPPTFADPEPEAMSAAPVSAAPVTPAVDMSPEVEASYEDGDVEISSETVEVDIDIDEPMPMESGAQPVGQQTMPPEDLEEELDEDVPTATQPSVRAPEPPQELEEVTHASAPPANEIEEPTPSSSRRPIAGEEPVAGTYEEESAPRHTPPPESGKQITAPSVNPPARAGSVPPPSLEGHTLIGGWREPGLGPAPAGPSGVRVPGPTGMGTEPPATIANVAQASATRLTADVTRPELSEGEAKVASFQGAAPIPKPTTLGELLDLTLGL